jgi:Holliday junction resolvase RusA-like endonuclease
MGTRTSAGELAPSTGLVEVRRTVFRCSVPGTPATKTRPRFGNGRAFTTKPTHVAEQRLRLYFGRAGVVREDFNDLGVTLVFRAATRQRRDIDNLVKLVLDAGNGVLWRDDNQVVELAAKLTRGDGDPGTDIEVYVVADRERACAKCGKTLTPVQTTYCSKACYDTLQRRGTYRACAGCGTAVYRQKDKALAKTVYCTPECRAAQRGCCRQCNAVLPNGHARTAFCSTECSVAWHRSRPLTTPVGGSCEECGRDISRSATVCRGCFLALQKAGSR